MAKKAMGLTAKQRERWDDAAMALQWAETGEVVKNGFRLKAMKSLLVEEAPEKDKPA